MAENNGFVVSGYSGHNKDFNRLIQPVGPSEAIPAQPTGRPNFNVILQEAIGLCMDAGLHPIDMIEPLKRELAWAQEQAGCR